MVGHSTSPYQAGALGKSRPSVVYQRISVLTAIAVLHLIAFFQSSSSLRIVQPLLKEGELQMIVFNPGRPPRTSPALPTKLMFKMPEAADVVAPDIQISPEPGIGRGASTNEVQSRIAPILDPSHANERPELPGTFGALIAALSLRLRLLVLPDGSIFDAHVVRSTGEADIDRVAIQWVETKLRSDRKMALEANDIWAMDFVHDQLFSGTKIRALTIIDTLARLSPAVDVRQSYRGKTYGRT